MSRITKEMASATSAQLVQSKKQELNDLTLKLQEIVTSHYLKTIPEMVMTVFKKHSGYFDTTKSCYLNGVGLSQGYKTYVLTQHLPSNDKMIKLSDADAEEIVSLENTIADKRKKLDTLRSEIEVALFNLRTYKNVEVEFPEAFKLLPPTPIVTALAINIKDIRCRLDKANC